VDEVFRQRRERFATKRKDGAHADIESMDD
jgi:hypothetical protein